MRTAAPVALLTKAEACERLRISPVTFWKHWQSRFTDMRQPHERKRGGHVRLVYADEVDAAVAVGGGITDRAFAAVDAIRRREGRR